MTAKTNPISQNKDNFCYEIKFLKIFTLGAGILQYFFDRVSKCKIIIFLLQKKSLKFATNQILVKKVIY